MKYLNKNINKFLFSIFMFLLPVTLALADGTTCDPNSGQICNPVNASTLDGLIKTILEGVIKIGIPIIALAIIYSGFLFVAARGNSEKISKAKDALLYTLIGAAILLGAWAIALLIKNTVLAL
jgi:hypothetical protein